MKVNKQTKPKSIRDASANLSYIILYYLKHNLYL